MPKSLTVQLKQEKALGCDTEDKAWIQDSGSQRTLGFWSKKPENLSLFLSKQLQGIYLVKLSENEVSVSEKKDWLFPMIFKENNCLQTQESNSLPYVWKTVVTLIN